MSVRVDAKDFAAAVAHAHRGLSPHPPRPEYAALVLSVTDGELTLSGYDGKVLAAARVSARGGDLSTVYPYGTTLARVAPRLSGEVTLAEEGASLVLATSGGRRYAVDLLPDGLYPSTPVMPPSLGDAPGFVEALRYVIESAGRDEAVPALLGVWIVAADGKLMMQATNRYELSRAVLPWDGLDFEVFVYAKTLGEFMRSMGGATLSVRTDGRRFGLTAGGLSASFPIAEGGYAWRGMDRMIDGARAAAVGDSGGLLTVRREVLLEAIKDIEPVLGNNDPVTFHLDPGNVQLSGRGAASQSRAAVPLGGEYVGPAMDVKIKYLGALTRVPSAYVVLGFLSPVKAVHVGGQREEDSEDIDLGAQHVVMPLRGNE